MKERKTVGSQGKMRAKKTVIGVVLFHILKNPTRRQAY